MDNEIKTLQIVDGIYDIQPLPIPAASLLEIALSTILFITVCSVVFYFIWKLLFSRKAIAKRKIHQLNKNHLTNNINSHEAVFRLCHITKEALRLKNLNKNTPLPKTIEPHINRWEEFLDNVSVLRYEKSSNKTINLDQLFIETLFWIKIWP